MFSDRAQINVEAGHGGNGCTAFRREKFVPHGGPSGGDGAPGGDVVIYGDDTVRDLSRFRTQVHWKGGRGGHGEGSQRHGRHGEPAEVPVPVGTQVYGHDGRLIADVTEAGQRVLVARAGLGGRGNQRFATATRQAPRFAERGTPGQEEWLTLQLKLLADAGLLGFPNAGKSSLLRAISNARPKVADYPFTTIVPQLGVVEVGDGRQVTVADIPGLLEGAHLGHGLGDAFLAHLERCRLLVHVVDVSDGAEAAVAAARAIHGELDGYGAGLADRPQLLVAHKIDTLDADQRAAAVAALDALRGELPVVGPVVAAAALTREGIPALIDELVRAWSSLPDPRPPVIAGVGASGGAEVVDYVLTPVDAGRAAPIEVSREDEGLRLSGPLVDRLLDRFDAGNPEAVRYVLERLEAQGATRALKRAGAAPGTEVRVGPAAFEFRDERDR